MLYVHLCCTHIFNTVCGSGPCASERTYQSWNSVRIGPQGWAECIGCSWSQSTGFLGLFATSILVFRENYPTLHNRASFLYILPKGDDICEQLFLKMKHRRSKISLKKFSDNTMRAESCSHCHQTRHWCIGFTVRGHTSHKSYGAVALFLSYVLVTIITVKIRFVN